MTGYDADVIQARAGRHAKGRRQMRTVAMAVAAMVAAAPLVSGCGGSGPPARLVGTVRARQPAASAAPSASGSALAGSAPGDLRGALLALGDLPDGFISRPLTARNLPSNLTGCRPLERLMAGAIGRHEQAEFFRPPLGPWIDEAVITPHAGAAAEVTAGLATAIDGCSSVTVTEEGQQVRLTLAPATASQVGKETHAYRATGTLRGLKLEMDIVLACTGGSIVLLTNAALADTTDRALTARVARIAADKARAA